MSHTTSRRTLLPWLAVGLAVFLIGLAMARVSLPEWRQQDLPDPDFFLGQLWTFLGQVGLVAPKCTPYFELTTDLDLTTETYQLLGGQAAQHLVDAERALVVEASLLTKWGESPLGHTRLFFAGTGIPWTFEFASAELSGLLPNSWRENRDDHHRDLAEAMSGTSFSNLGPPVTATATGLPKKIYIVPGSENRESENIETVSILTSRAWTSEGQRRVGSIDLVKEQIESWSLGGEVLLVGRFLLAALVFTILAFRRRLGLMTAAIFAIPVFILGFHAVSVRSFSSIFFFASISAVVFKTLFVFVLWASAESWIRSTIPGFSTSLDALRGGYLGPRGGRSLLGGWALGAALAGVGLMLFSLAVRLPGIHPSESSIPLPIFGQYQSPLGTGILSAGFVLLALAACRNLLPADWVVPVAAVLAAVLNLPQVDIQPWPFALVVSLIFNALLVWTYQKFGTTGLLTATLIQASLPAAVFSAFHFSWMPGSFVTTALFSLVVPVLGWIGLSRSAEGESARMVAPAYVRRLEDERRIRYEMDLLGRMQKGLLPESTPDIDGYQVAATSILANEAGGDLYDFLRDAKGGLWVAAGDVSGHGLSCTIEHAMTKAALTSLVQAGQRPSQILHDVDRVLRTARSIRSFTSLSLLRLDPDSGQVVFSNAGHPYPILLDGHDLSEISLPSLPLGQGPKREYRDQSLMLREGAVLVLLSDGLFESTNTLGRAYGYPRTRQMLKENVHLSAQEILDVLIADWRHHVGPGSPADDTTVVVLKRQRAESRDRISDPIFRSLTPTPE